MSIYLHPEFPLTFEAREAREAREAIGLLEEWGHHSTRRGAEVYAARRALEIAGWRVRLPRWEDGFRLPIVLPGERQPLDGSLADQRATGFVASEPETGAELAVDASVGESLLFLRDIGNTDAAKELVTRYLGPKEQNP